MSIQFNIRNIREISNEPSTKFANKLAKRLARFTADQQAEKLEGKFDIYSAGQDVDTVVKFHSLVSTNHFAFDKDYYPPWEPDYFFQRLWIKGYNTGNTMKDFSEQGHEIRLWNDAVIMDGTPFDYGIHDGNVKSICLRFNDPNTASNDQHIIVPETTDLKFSSITTGFSIFMRFRIHDLSTTASGISATTARTLFHKIDDNLILDAAMLQVKDDGKLVFIIKDAGGTFAKETAAGTITTNTVYEMWITYTAAGNVIHIYLNNVDKTLTTFAGSINWALATDHDLTVFRRGISSGANGYVYGDLYDYEYFQDKIMNATDVSRHYTNKWTVSNIPFGQVMVSNYWAPKSIGGVGYTLTGFTTTGYTAG